MQVTKLFLALYILMLGFSTGCYRNSNEVWEDSKSASRHLSRGLRTMGGKHGDSRAIQNRDDFMPSQNENGYNDPYGMNSQTRDEFVPLSDQAYEDEIAMANYISRQPRETPGDPGSSIPPIDAFQDPSMNSNWSRVFRNIHFDYNSDLVKGQENMQILRNIIDYMKSNQGLYVFVEGHTDERGPEAYNLALAARRSNSVRNLLIDGGINPDNIFTISYGKERPLLHDQNENSWAQNRRVEFKIYQR